MTIIFFIVLICAVGYVIYILYNNHNKNSKCAACDMFSVAKNRVNPTLTDRRSKMAYNFPNYNINLI